MTFNFPVRLAPTRPTLCFCTTYVSTVCPHVVYAPSPMCRRRRPHHRPRRRSIINCRVYNLRILHILYVIATVCVVRNNNIIYLNKISSRAAR